MVDDDSGGWRLGHQPDDWYSPRSMRIRDEARQRQQEAHEERVAQRKRDREEARRKAKGLPSSPTDYAWLEPDWVEPPVMPLRLRNRR
jgi:hypothetical protein